MSDEIKRLDAILVGLSAAHAEVLRAVEGNFIVSSPTERAAAELSRAGNELIRRSECLFRTVLLDKLSDKEGKPDAE